MPATVTFSARTPVPASTQNNYDGRLTCTITPSSIVNPITIVTCLLNGAPCVVSTASLGPSGALACAARGPGHAASLNTVAWTATTADTTVNNDPAYTYTARPRWGPTAALADLSTFLLVPTAAVADHAVPPRAVTAVVVDYALLQAGLLNTTPAVVDYSVQPRAGGLLNSLPGVVDYYAVQPEAWLLVPIGAVPADRRHEPLAVGLSVYGIDHAVALPAGVIVRGTDHQVVLYAGASVKVRRFEVLAYVGAVVAQVHREPLPVGTSLDRVTARLTVEAMAVSTRRKAVETEP